MRPYDFFCVMVENYFSQLKVSTLSLLWRGKPWGFQGAHLLLHLSCAGYRLSSHFHLQYYNAVFVP